MIEMNGRSVAMSLVRYTRWSHITDIRRISNEEWDSEKILLELDPLPRLNLGL